MYIQITGITHTVTMDEEAMNLKEREGRAYKRTWREENEDPLSKKKQSIKETTTTKKTHKTKQFF